MRTAFSSEPALISASFSSKWKCIPKIFIFVFCTLFSISPKSSFSSPNFVYFFTSFLSLPQRLFSLIRIFISPKLCTLSSCMIFSSSESESILIVAQCERARNKKGSDFGPLQLMFFPINPRVRICCNSPRLATSTPILFFFDSKMSASDLFALWAKNIL